MLFAIVALVSVARADTPDTPAVTAAVDPTTAEEWKRLSANTARFNKEKAAACPEGSTFTYGEPPTLALEINQCGGMYNGEGPRTLVTALDNGSTSAIVAAGVVAQCPSILAPDDTVEPSTWFSWRLCQRLDGFWTNESLDAELKAAGASEWVRLDFELRAQVARGFLASNTSAYATLEKGYPGLLALYNDSVAQVDAGYVPRIEVARADLLAIDPWFATLSGGPGFAEGCQERWTGALQAYVDSQGITAKGTALWDVVRDPVGVALTEAVSACQKSLGRTTFSRMIAEKIIPGSRRTLGWHPALDNALRLLRKGAFVYKGQALPPNLGYSMPFFSPKNPVREWIGDYYESKDRVYSGHGHRLGQST